jgi:hypothetical protein
MIRLYKRMIVLILTMILIAACTPESTTTSTAPALTAVTPTRSSTLTAISPTPTAPPVTPTSTSPTTVPSDGTPTEISTERSDSIKIRITIDGTEHTATLNDSQTTRDFLALLPLTLTMEDYAGTEKVSDLPASLSTEGAPEGSDPSVGDIGYYAPWGNLAIYYRDFRYSSGLVILGKIDGGMEAFSGSGPVNVTIEPMD